MKIKLNVLITGQNKLMCEGPLAILAQDESITVDVAELEAERLLKKVRLFHPDVVLFSADLYDTAVMEQISLVKGELPDVKTMLLMSTYDERFVIEGIIEGVDGFLLNDGGTDTKRLLENIQDLYQDGYMLSGSIAKNVMHQMMEDKTKQQLEINLLKWDIKVTRRELDILYLLMKNYSNQEMASLFDVKEKSVREYVSNAYSKIGINKRNEAVAFLQEIMNVPGEKELIL